MSETVHSGPGDGPSDVASAPSAAEQQADSRGRMTWTPKRVAVAVVIAAVVIWIGIKAADDFKKFVTVTLNGLTLSALYFVVASGFTLIFGLMRVVNMAHGTLYLLGGYLALNFQQKLFAKDDGGLNLSLSAGGGGGGGDYNLVGWIVPLAMAVLLVGILGVAIQQLFLRWNQGQDLRQALITIAISVIAADQMLAAYGGIAKDIKAPSEFPQSVILPGDIRFGFFRLVIVVGSALLIGVGLYLLIKRTRYGKIVRAGVDDRDMVVGARHQHPARLRGRVLHRRDARGLRRRARRHDDLAPARRGHLVPAQLADRRDHRRDGQPRRRGDRRDRTRARRRLRATCT